jgi:lipoprotein-anchoring transpeptidase ErfK/SrfK
MPMLFTMKQMQYRRVAAVVVMAALAVSGCGYGRTLVTGQAVPTTSAPSVSTTVAPPTTRAATTTSTTTTTTTTTTIPVDPYETFVANIVDEVAVLDAFEEPDGEPARFEFAITNPTYFGNPLALMITERTDDGRWLKVQIPVRPNGSEAWIRADDAEVTSHRFRAEVDLTERAVTVWDGAALVAETTAVVGKSTTPTPLGSFFVNDFVEKWDGSAYGPHILTLSGFSEALETFGGGIPVIAIHGTNRPDLMGGAHSNGCIRIPNNVIQVLADTVPIGTPVDIIAS